MGDATPDVVERYADFRIQAHNSPPRFQTRRRGVAEVSKSRTLDDMECRVRTTLSAGAVLLSGGVYELPDMVKAAAIRKVVSFDEFTDDNDPHGEHDFGKFELFFWKKLLR